MNTDPIVAQWYELFLDVWNQRFRLEQQPREWLAALWKAFGGDPVANEERGVIINALLLRVRADFVALDCNARAVAAPSADDLARLQRDACRLHERWLTVFRAERVPMRVTAPVRRGYAAVTD